MWQRFTEQAKRVIYCAQEESGLLGESYVSTEHLLLGLVREEDNAGSRVLKQLGVSLADTRSVIEQHVVHGTPQDSADMQLTPRSKRVIDLAYDEARLLKNKNIGPEHILLGLIREGEGLGGRILSKFGADIDSVRQVIMTGIAEFGDDGVWPPPPKMKRDPELRYMCTLRLRECVSVAEHIAKSFNCHSPLSEHCLLALTRKRDSSAARTLRKLNCNMLHLRMALLSGIDSASNSAKFDEFAHTWFFVFGENCDRADDDDEAYMPMIDRKITEDMAQIASAGSDGSRPAKLTTDHLLAAILDGDGFAQKIASRHNVTRAGVLEMIAAENRAKPSRL